MAEWRQARPAILWEEEALSVLAEWFSDPAAATVTSFGYHLLGLDEATGVELVRAAEASGWTARQYWTGSEWEVEVCRSGPAIIDALLADGSTLDRLVGDYGGRWVFSWIGDD